jgi:putative spermidine/putrescine transport system permease protein
VRTSSHGSLGRIVLWLYGLLVVVFLLTPLVVVVSMSFSEPSTMAFPPTGFTWKWYAKALAVTGLGESFVRSIELALLSALVSAVLGTFAAVGMANRKFPGKALITSFFLSPLVFPSIVVGVALLQFNRTIHYNDVFVTMLLGHVVVTIPYTIRTVTASLEVFDYTLLDAARVLGADGPRTFFEVMLPIIKPGVFSGSIFAFLVSFDNYTVSMFLADAKNITLPIRIYNYSEASIDPSITAVAAIMILVSIAIFAISGKLIGVRGLSKF